MSLAASASSLRANLLRHSLLPAIIAFGLLQPAYPVIKVTGEPPIWRLEPLARIVSPDGVGFTQIGSVLLDPRGGLLIVDRKEQVIYRYDDGGKMLGTIGRVGSGPSEFRVPYALGWLGDELMVFDPENARILRWTREAKYLGQITLMSRAAGVTPVFPSADGQVWLRQSGRGPSGNRQQNFTRFPGTGRGDTIWLPYNPPTRSPKVPTGGNGFVVCNIGGTTTEFGSPFREPMAHRVVSGQSELVEINSVGYQLAVMKSSGDTIRVLEHVVAPVPISEAEWQMGLKDYKEWSAENPAATCTGRFIRPVAKPAIRDLATDDGGRVWVERYMRTGFQWEAWQGDKIVGAFAMPDSASNLNTAFGGDRVAFVRYREEDGGSEVRLYRIRR